MIVSKNIAIKISDGKIDYFVEMNILVKDYVILTSSSMNWSLLIKIKQNLYNLVIYITTNCLKRLFNVFNYSVFTIYININKWIKQLKKMKAESLIW